MKTLQSEFDNNEVPKGLFTNVYPENNNKNNNNKNRHIKQQNNYTLSFEIEIQ